MIRYPLASETWDNKEYSAIQEVVSSGMFTMGPKVAKFEFDFSNLIGSKYAVMVNSGSSANLLMIASLFYTKNEYLRLKRGDEVIVPAVSWSTTYYPLHQYGLKIKFVDIDLQTLNFDINELEKSITNKTRLIFAVNLLGNSNKFDKINEIIKQKNIILIEDNCESLGAKFQGKNAGTFGLMGSFSTFFSHHISTMEGGVVVTDDEELYHILISLRAHGWTRNLPKINHVCGTKSDDYFSEAFRFVLPGYNVRPIELSGAIGSEQLKKLPVFIEERRKNAKIFENKFKDHPTVQIQSEIGESSWFGFSFLVRPGAGVDRGLIISKLIQNKVEVRPIVAGNFSKNEVVKYFDYEICGDLKNSDYVDKNGFFVGNHHFPIVKELELLSKLMCF